MLIIKIMCEESEMKNINIADIDTKQIDNALFDMWIQHELLADNVCEPVNVENLKRMFFEAKEKKLPVDIMAIGCQQFAEVADSTGQTVSIPSNMELKDSTRFGRFTNELICMRKALHSFGVETRLAITFSDVECQLIEMMHPAEPLFKAINIQKIMSRNTNNFISKMKQAGLASVAFSHARVLMEVFGLSNFEGLIQFLFAESSSVIDSETLLENLYNSDPRNLPPIVANILHAIDSKDSVGMIWLDTMSPMAGIHRDRLHSSIKLEQSEMPIIVPFRNSGKWETAVEPERIISTKQQFISKILGLSLDKSPNNWLREAISLPDNVLHEFLQKLGIEILITDSRSKSFAVSILEKLAFGTDKFSISEAEDVEIQIGQGIINILRLKTGWPGNHIRDLLIKGKVLVNDIPITHPNEINLQDGDVISVGKVKLRISLLNE